MTGANAFSTDGAKGIQDEILARVNDLRKQYPDWMQRYDDCVLETASRAEFEALYSSAPEDFLRGQVWGLIVMRMFISSVTGVDFK